jgi:hypothetical protein
MLQSKECTSTLFFVVSPSDSQLNLSKSLGVHKKEWFPLLEAYFETQAITLGSEFF